MRETRLYCDACGKENKHLFTLDLERPVDWFAVETGLLKVADKDRQPCFGKHTVDGMWEMELCHDCMVSAILKLRSLKI